MKWSKAFIYTLKESPADAEIPSHKLMVRGGYIKKLAPGIFTYGPLALKAIRKFEKIVREEHDSRGAVELLMPMVQPKELWEETNRWSEMGDGLLKFENRNGHGFCLGATHEEVITDYVRRDVKSYRDLPVTLYQVQTKFRDEIRPRFGLMRGREFIMKDAYSFDLTPEEARKSYDVMYDCYSAIFRRLGVEFRVVQADSGNIGGSLSHEFQILAESGEDQLLVSSDGDFAANIEICPAEDANPEMPSGEDLRTLESFPTPGLKTIVDLSKATGVPDKGLVKTMFFSAADGATDDLKPVAVLLRGSDEVNPIKVKNLLGLANPPELLTDKEVQGITGAWPGSCGPVGLKIPIYMDKAVENMRNYMVGANKDDEHLRHVNHGRDYQVTKVGDLRMAREGDKSPDGKGTLKAYRGIEVGHIFYLGTKYSKAMNASYLNTDGKLELIEMGCYGIGISRTVQAVIEQNNDKDGIVWPVSIAPFHVHICHLDPEDQEVNALAEKIYKELAAKGVDVLLDDRKERPGVKFKDADLLGMPLRLTIGARGLKDGGIEVVNRRTKDMAKVPPADIVEHVVTWLKENGWS
ncbi:MAG: proline--tRNA ligase [Bdellovibrionaceae bacterium]|nr:proline--tRNA ligase [Bdellovibrionales bacterium]MCB9084687.1 proline--tRNA ligase [Pseudobdellovibrionaceae bacterium]